MPIGTRGVLDWVLAAATAAVWFATYALFFSRDPDLRRKARLILSSWRHHLTPRARRRRPHALPVAQLARPVSVWRPPPPPPARRALPAASGNAALAVPEPARIAEWRADRLPMRYRLLGHPRRGVNDN